MANAARRRRGAQGEEVPITAQAHSACWAWKSSPLQNLAASTGSSFHGTGPRPMESALARRTWVLPAATSAAPPATTSQRARVLAFVSSEVA